MIPPNRSLHSRSLASRLFRDWHGGARSMRARECISMRAGALWQRGGLSLAVLAMMTACAACGGGGAESASTKAPERQAQPAAAPEKDPGPPTTTTALETGSGSSGTKLESGSASTSQTGATPPDATGPSPTGAHHEPGRSVADIKAIVVAHRDEARACYDNALPAHPGIEGDLVVQWIIDPKGNVTQISLDTARSQVTEPSVVACVIGVIKKVQFAASPGGYETRTSYPFNFHPRHGRASTQSP